MLNPKKLISMILTLTMVLLILPSFSAAAADLSLNYTLNGNTGATITATSGTITSATVDDASLASALVSDGTVTVTGEEGAVGIVTVTVNGSTQVEIPIGYTTFLFDGDSVTVYSGSSNKYELYGISTASTDEITLAGVTNGDGSVTYTNTDAYKINVNIKKAGGTYVFSGTGNDMSISVNKGATGDANILLAGLTLSSSFTAPITVKKESSAAVYITSLAGSSNKLSDAALNNADIYGDTEDGGDGSNAEYAESAVIKGKSYANVTLNGSGILNVVCRSKNGIKVGEYGSLTIESVTLTVTSAGHGISADNLLTIHSGKVTVTANGGDGIRSDPDTVDASSGQTGCITINGGTVTVTASSDGIQAAQDVTINGGTFNIKTGSGYQDSSFNKDIMSCKGIKASNNSEDTSSATNTITITGGTFHINTADDAIHSDAYIVITGGTFEIYSGDDGVHADTSLTLGTKSGSNSAVTLNVKYAYEGLEAGNVYIYSGKYNAYATDDGINAAGDSSTSSFNPGGQPGGRGGNYGSQTLTSDYNIYIYGGEVYVNALGDGLDSNGGLYLLGGTVTVWGAAAGSDNQPLDCDGTLTINGATVFAAGSSAMGVRISSTNQKYVTSTATIGMGSTINVSNGAATVYSTTAIKRVNYVLYSSPSMTSTTGWTISAANSSTTGWQKKDGYWYYYVNGSLTTGWKKINNKWYIFSYSDGKMLTGWVKSGGKWYYMHSNGDMRTGWLKYNGSWYYLSSSGAMVTGWVKVNGYWYCFNRSGKMLTGWIYSGGKWYYCESTGEMRTAALTYNGTVYYFSTSGVCTNA